MLDNLRITSITPSASVQTCSPVPPRYSSVLSRLTCLSVEIFEGVCQTPTFHPARDFQAIVNSASSLVLKPKPTDSQNGQIMDDAAIQSLLESINESGLEWPMNLFDSGADFGTSWELDRFIRS